MSLQHLIAAGLIKPPLDLEKMYKDRRFSARLEAVSADVQVALAHKS